MKRCMVMLIGCTLMQGHPVSAQRVTSWGGGPTWSNMATAEPGGSSYGNTMRRFLSVWLGHRVGSGGPIIVDASAHLVAKGFEVSGPTIHAEWLDLPLTATLRPDGTVCFDGRTW